MPIQSAGVSGSGNRIIPRIDSWRHQIRVNKLKISELSLSYVVCVGGRSLLWPTHFQHANNIVAASRGWKADSSFKYWHFMEHGLNQFHTWFLLNSRNLFSPITRPKIPAQDDLSILIFCQVLMHVFLKRKISWGSLILYFIRKQKNGEKKC